MAKPQFRNVDLEIASAPKLDSLVAEMGKRVVVLYCGPVPKRSRHFVALEVSRFYKNPDVTIQAFCSIVDDLSPAARRTWNAARKTFDIGFELRPSERSSHITIRTDTLERIARLGANLIVTCYQAEPGDALGKVHGQKRRPKHSG